MHIRAQIRRASRVIRRAVIAAATCISCGAEYGQPYTPACKFEL